MRQPHTLEETLRTGLHEVPPPDGRTKSIALAAIRGAYRAGEPPVPFWQFLFRQAAFIRKRVWGFQFAILAGFAYLMSRQPDLWTASALLAFIGPLVFLSGLAELMRPYQYQTYEMELTTRYSLRQILLSRVLVLGMADLLCLTALYLCSSQYLSLSAYTMILYLCVPFLTACFGCLYILNRAGGRNMRDTCLAFALLTSCAGVAAVIFPQQYAITAMWAWAVLLIIGLAGAVLECRRMISQNHMLLERRQYN
ncbi:MAG: hypothetical protein LIO46_05340 [Clostridiales bacterium]|nr:hypothetical protein [Clostridiales bacterium]